MSVEGKASQTKKSHSIPNDVLPLLDAAFERFASENVNGTLP